MSNEKILITAALPYINNVPHMGHIVGSHLPADIFYRYCIAKGYDAIFVGGSDEHGTPSTVAAQQLGLKPQQLVDKLHQVHQLVYAKLQISYKKYSRTSNPDHHKMVSDFFREIYQKGFIFKDNLEMFFCERDQMFLPDRFVIGNCPYCQYDHANADQCENCTRILLPNELIHPKCHICNAVPVIKKSEHLYFSLEKFSKDLDQWIERQKNVWRSHVYSDAKKWINEGLKSRSITRDLSWGVPVPKEIGLEKVFYVWFDAPIGYMTFVKELSKDKFEQYWKDSNAKIYHFLGKDNIPFHTIFWPAMLLAHGGLNLPFNVVGYHYLNYEHQKFSKRPRARSTCRPRCR